MKMFFRGFTNVLKGSRNKLYLKSYRTVNSDLNVYRYFCGYSKCEFHPSKTNFSFKNQIFKTNTLRKCSRDCCRLYSSFRKASQEQLVVRSYGEPKDVIEKEVFNLPQTLGKNEIIGKVLASPINPADINTIQGVYSIKPSFPFIPGNEAVLEVVETGEEVNTLQAGDLVIPRVNAMGTWKTSLVADEKKFIKLPAGTDITTAATIAVNPCTAYRMMTDFVTLQPGDVIIQNCANSAVGQAAIQIAAAKGIRTINIVRQRPNFEELKDYLTSLGATIVLPDSELRSSKEVLKQYPKPLLALNGVSGKPAAELLRLLSDGGTMVTYGGMSRQPLMVPVGSLIFNGVEMKGFWMTRWNQLNEFSPEREAMLDYLLDLNRKGNLQPPSHELVPFSEYERALCNAMPSGGMVGKKQILQFD